MDDPYGLQYSGEVIRSLTELSRVSASYEIERKFLVRRLPAGIERCAQRHMLQGYLVVAENQSEVRIRSSEGRCTLAVKGAGDVMRSEHEIEISREVFDELWPATEGRRLEKIRYEVWEHGRLVELDFYRGHLEGLVLAEVEFESLEASHSFKPPEWFGREITRDLRFRNHNLAGCGKDFLRVIERDRS